MSLYNKYHSYIIQPFSDFVTGWQFSKSLEFLKKSQWWSKDRLYEFQCAKLQDLIQHAYKNTFYYKQLFDNYGISPKSIVSPEDLGTIPITSKKDFRLNFPEKITASNVSNNDFVKTATSGSTGRQLIYYITKNAYGMIKAAGVRGWYWAGYKLGDKYIKVTQNERQSSLKRLQDYVNRAYLYANKYDESGFMELIDLINVVRPKILRSYPDPLVFLVNYISEKSIVLPHIGAVSTTGNTLFKETRDLIEETLKTRVFDSYSCEGSTHADECETHTCYHTSDEYAITEILDERGHEVNPGEIGLHITTDLWNYANPFIRYDTRDYIVKGETNCVCGRGLSQIKRIDGRDNDILITPGGKYLIAQSFTTYFKYFESVEQFQVVQDSLDHLIIKVVTNNKYNTDIEKKIIEYWEKYTSGQMKVCVEVVEEISSRLSGKRQFLVRNPLIKL